VDAPTPARHGIYAPHRRRIQARLHSALLPHASGLRARPQIVFALYYIKSRFSSPWKVKWWYHGDCARGACTIAGRSHASANAVTMQSFRHPDL